MTKREKTIHLAFVIANHTPNNRQLQMARSASKKSWKVTFVAWNRNEKKPDIVSSKEHFDSIKYIHIQAGIGSATVLLKIPALYLKIYRLIKSLDPVDIIVVTHFILLPLSFLFKEKVIYDSSETHVLNLSRRFGKYHHFIYRMLEGVEGLFAKKVQGITTVDSRNGWYAEYYKKWNPHVQVLWNLPSLQDESKNIPSSKLRENYNGKTIIAFVGGLRKEKGFRIALQAASLVKMKKNVHFIFFGEIKEDIKYIKTYLKMNRLEDNVRFLNALPYPELLSHLRYAQIGLALYQPDIHYPYMSEGNARKIFTYMQAGLAVIGPHFGEIGLAVQKAGCGKLIDTTSAECVSDAILEMIADHEKLKQFQKNGRQAFLCRYHWETIENQYITFLHRVLSDFRYSTENI